MSEPTTSNSDDVATIDKPVRPSGIFARLYAAFPQTTKAGSAVAAGVIVLVLWMAWNASKDNALVIKPLSVPSDLQKTGLTGDVAAAHFLDQLSELDQKAHQGQRDVIIAAGPDVITAEHLDSRIADIKVQIPHTGVSVGDLDQLLRQLLGHRKVISGDIVQTPGGWLTTIRSDATSAVQVTSNMPMGIFPEKLIEDSYGQFQPLLYANYLVQQKTVQSNLKADKLLGEILDGRRGGTTKDEAAWASWALATVRAQEPGNDLKKVLGLLDHAIFWRPNYALAFSALQWIDQLAGDDQKGYLDAQLALKQFSKPTRNLSAGEVEAQRVRLMIRIAEYEGAFLVAGNIANPKSISEPYEDEASLVTFSHAQNLALAHDPSQAQSILDIIRSNVIPISTPADDVYVQWGNTYVPQFFIQADQGNWAAAVKSMQHADDVAANKGGSLLYYKRSWFDPWLAYANIKAGNRQRADMLINATPRDCYLCLRMRGRIYALEGDLKAANTAFRDAAAKAPSLPAAYLELGDVLFAQNNISEASAQYTLAERRGSNSAEPFERIGEVLLKQGRWSAALAKFSLANEFAPKWGRLHFAAAKAWARGKRADKAEQEENIAKALVASPDDRKAIAAL